VKTDARAKPLVLYVGVASDALDEFLLGFDTIARAYGW
jgi:hypothetical protein